MAYLFEAFDGSAATITDDLVYRWLRKEVNGQKRITMRHLAAVLAEPDFAWIGGITGDQRLSNLFQSFAVAKFSNAVNFATDGRFGYSAYDPMRETAMFKDECTWYRALCQTPPETPIPPDLDCPLGPSVPLISIGCWNARILPPDFLLNASIENNTHLETGLYALNVPGSPSFDGSKDLIDVALYGTDYIIFRADEYYQDGEEHVFHFDLRGLNPVPASGDIVKVWAVGYDAYEGMLNQQPGSVIFVQPLTVVNNNASLVVTSFGGRVLSVVIVVTLVEEVARDDATQAPLPSNDYFTYEYEFGVQTPGSMNLFWGGTALVFGDVTVPPSASLTIAPGTIVRVATTDAWASGSDPQRVEFNIEGSIVADGTSANPIVFESMTPTTTEDWVGFYFDSQSAPASFDNVRISRAEIGIESYVNLTVTNSTFEDCRYSGVTGHDGTALVQGCTLTDPGTWGIFLTAADATIRNTTVDNAVSAALHVQPNATVVARNSQFLNSDKGLFINGNAAVVNVDSTCAFNSNGIGIHCYSTGATPVIKNSTFDSNTGSGVFCDNSSHPLIQGNTMRYNNFAVYCSNEASPTIKSSVIKSNANGIWASSGSNPDIGHYSSTGNNTIAFSSGYLVLNFNEAALYAQNNCWNDDTAPCDPKASKLYGDVDTSNPICCSVPSGVSEGPLPEPETALPTETDLVAVVPNPFNPSTTIQYSLAAQSSVSIVVYDVAGRLVRELVNRTEPAGARRATWEGVDAQGVPVASGVYFVKMSAGSFTRTMKMVLLK